MTKLHVLDLDYLGHPGSIASYVLEAPGGPVMIECGPGSTQEALTRGLKDLGLAPSDVRHLLLTHIHFDHAGAAGWMASQGATVHVHEFGAKHLIDPSKLIASATRIYGDEMDRLWGDILPVPEDQANAVRDGDVLDVGGLEIRAIETPGHARHHHAFATEVDGVPVCFTGDAAAAVTPEAPGFISLPAPPPEFDLDAWMTSLDRLDSEGFHDLYPTHFGKVDRPAAHLERVRRALREHVRLIGAYRDQGLERDEMIARYQDWFTREAVRAGVPEAKMDFFAKGSLVAMNLTGVGRWMDKRAEAARG